jgi:hypothetical protein
MHYHLDLERLKIFVSDFEKFNTPPKEGEDEDKTIEPHLVGEHSDQKIMADVGKEIWGDRIILDGSELPPKKYHRKRRYRR